LQKDPRWNGRGREADGLPAFRRGDDATGHKQAIAPNRAAHSDGMHDNIASVGNHPALSCCHRNQGDGADDENELDDDT
jgi:hypothetical protein